MKSVVLVLALPLLLVSAANAGQNPDVGLALHVQSIGDDCWNHGIIQCNQFVTAWPALGESIDVYVFVSYLPNGITGTEFSLVWPPEWVFGGWTSCADMESGTIEAPGDGVIQTWFLCQPPGAPKAAGILRLIPTTPGRVLVWTHPVTGRAAVWDCTAPPGFDVVLPIPPADFGNGRAGWVDVANGLPGCNPSNCFFPPCYPPPTAAEATTWGAVKALYR